MSFRHSVLEANLPRPRPWEFVGSSDITASCTSVKLSSPIMHCTFCGCTRKILRQGGLTSTVRLSIRLFSSFAPVAQSATAAGAEPTPLFSFEFALYGGLRVAFIGVAFVGVLVLPFYKAVERFRCKTAHSPNYIAVGYRLPEQYFRQLGDYSRHAATMSN